MPVEVFAGSDQDYKVTVDQLEAARTDRTKVLLLCSPSNPTGSVYTMRVMRPDGLPLDPLRLSSLETGFFRSAHPEFSFRLREGISYVWLAPVRDAAPQEFTGTRSKYDG